MLAREYCRRGHYFLNLYFSQDGSDFEYTQSHVDGYKETDAFKAWFAALPVGGVVHLRVLEMRLHLAPTLGPVGDLEDDEDEEEAIV